MDLGRVRQAKGKDGAAAPASARAARPQRAPGNGSLANGAVKSPPRDPAEVTEPELATGSSGAAEAAEATEATGTAGSSGAGEQTGATGNGRNGAAPRRRSRFASAGRCLGVGLVCFFLWTLFDANQLYQSAESSPFGVRRSVAMSILRPLAAISNGIGLSSIVDGGNDVLGKAQSNTSTNFNVVIPPPSQPAPVPWSYTKGSGGFPAVPHNLHPGEVPKTAPPPPSGNGYQVPPLTQPTAQHPLTVLDIGDSVGTDFGFGLGDEFGSDPYTRLYQEGKVDTGLADTGYYNWPQHLAGFLHQYHPKVVVVMLGGNDTLNLEQNGQYAAFGTALWRKDYALRVDEVMAECLAAKAHVFWVGMPIMGDPGLSSAMLQINHIFSTEAAKYPGDVTYFSSWKLFTNSAGQFAYYLPNSQGQQVQVRYSDGVHLAPAGYDMLAAAVVRPMEQAWHIRLFPAGQGG